MSGLGDLGEGPSGVGFVQQLLSVLNELLAESEPETREAVLSDTTLTKIHDIRVKRSGIRTKQKLILHEFRNQILTN